MESPVTLDQFAVMGEMSSAELLKLKPAELVERHRSLMRGYLSLLEVNGLYRRQLAAIRDHTLQSALIADLARKINMTDLGQIADVVVEDCPRLFEATGTALFLFDADSRVISLYRALPVIEESLQAHADHDRDTLLPLLLSRFRDPLSVEGRKDFEQRAGQALAPHPANALLDEGALLCPLLIGPTAKEMIPVGGIVFGGKPSGFSRVDVDLATMVSEMVATSINAARLLHRMSVLAETDGLTGLNNHRTFQQTLDVTIARVRRYAEPLSLSLIDIDHFKNVNDRYGHQFGDCVLREVARVIKSSVRDVDTTARYGGEEFAVIMPNTSLAGAELTIERIRQRIARDPVVSGGQEVQVRISAGVAQYLLDRDKNDLINRADQALYKAKSQGRNQVVTDKTVV